MIESVPAGGLHPQIQIEKEAARGRPFESLTCLQSQHLVKHVFGLGLIDVGGEDYFRQKDLFRP